MTPHCIVTLGIDIFLNDRRMHRSMLCQNDRFLVGSVPIPSFEIVFCFICSRRRVAVIQQRITSLVIEWASIDL